MNGGLKLKLDGWVKRDPDRSARHIPVKPLTELEIAYLSSVCWDKCLRAYKSRMISSALMSDYETDKDLDGEAFIAMLNILRKFDTSKCGKVTGFVYQDKKGKKTELYLDEWIKKGAKIKYRMKKDTEIMYFEYKGVELKNYDVPGATKPKTLEFYFTNYFYGRVNFIACESRAQKKQRGVGPVESIGEITYDPEDTQNISIHNHQYEITGVILSELEKKSVDFKRFFYQTLRLECTQRELREEYGERFNVLRQELNKFINEIKKTNRVDYSGAGN